MQQAIDMPANACHSQDLPGLSLSGCPPLYLSMLASTCLLYLYYYSMQGHACTELILTCRQLMTKLFSDNRLLSLRAQVDASCTGQSQANPA